MTHQRRVRLHHPRPAMASVGVIPNLLARETNVKHKRVDALESSAFSRLQCRSTMDVYQHIQHSMLIAPELLKRAPVGDVVQCGQFICILTQTGLAALFEKNSGMFVAVLNSFIGEVVRSIIFNQYRNSIVLCCAFKEQRYSSLTVRELMLSPGATQLPGPLFASEDLNSHNFIEFDIKYGLILTHNKQHNRFRLWDLKSYAMTLEFNGLPNLSVSQIKMYQDSILLIHNADAEGRLPLAIIEKNNGRIVKHWLHPLHRNRKIDIIELINTRFLFKQAGLPLQIYNLSQASCAIVPHSTDFENIRTIIALPQYQQLMFFRNRQPVLMCANTGLMQTVPDCTIFGQDAMRNKLCLSSNQDKLFCLSSLEGLSHPQFSLFSLSRGRHVSEVDCSCVSSEGRLNESAATCEQFENINCMAFDENGIGIVLGTTDGKVRWFA